MKSVLYWTLRSALLALLLVHSQPVNSNAEQIINIGTGSITGVYYNAGSAVAKMFNQKRQEYNAWMLNRPSAGSIYNIDSVLEGENDFGIAQANFLFNAWNGKGLWENIPKRDLRAVLGLYVEDVTLIAAEDAEINNVLDLKGKRLNIGAPGSSDHETSGFILEQMGLDPVNDLQISEWPTYIASEKIQSDDIDAYFYTVGHPNLSVLEAISGERKVRIVPFKREFVDKIIAPQPFLSASEIDVEFYDKLDNKDPVPTIGIKSVLFTSKDVDEETVYRVVKAVMENLDLFRRQHPAFAKLTKESMTHRVIVPLHPGAERYFREAGIAY
jgi:TRAP transporter TAXI family solute receptor